MRNYVLFRFPLCTEQEILLILENLYRKFISTELKDEMFFWPLKCYHFEEKI
jgi:hypothetical protein